MHTLLAIPAYWTLPHEKNIMTETQCNSVIVQYSFMWAVNLCSTLKLAFNICRIGHKFQASHGYALQIG